MTSMDSKSFTLDIQENPMHSQFQQENKNKKKAMEIELAVLSSHDHDRNDHDRNHNSSTSTSPTTQQSKIVNLVNTFKGGCLYLLSTFVVGFVFIGSQLLASFAANTTEESIIDSTVNILKWRWWWSVDPVEFLFFLAILSALFHFVLNTSGGARNKLFAILSILCSWIIVGIIVGIEPSSYLRVQNITKSSTPDRGGCHSIRERNADIPLLDGCFVDHGGDAYVTYHYNDTSDLDSFDRNINQAATGLALLFDLTDLLSGAANDLIPDQRLHGFFHKECFIKVPEVVCGDIFRRCRELDCAGPTTKCFDNMQATFVADSVSCIKKQCYINHPDLDCVSINNMDIGKLLEETETKLIRAIRTFVSDEDMIGLLEYALERGVFYFKSVPEPQEMKECMDWKIDLTTDTTQNNNVIGTCNNNATIVHVISSVSFDSGMLTSIRRTFADPLLVLKPTQIA